MGLIRRRVPLTILFAFLSFVTLQTVHVHKTMPSDAMSCDVCKIAHSSPILENSTSMLGVPEGMEQAPQNTFSATPHLVVFVSHGLAPPSL